MNQNLSKIEKELCYIIENKCTESEKCKILNQKLPIIDSLKIILKNRIDNNSINKSNILEKERKENEYRKENIKMVILPKNTLKFLKLSYEMIEKCTNSKEKIFLIKNYLHQRMAIDSYLKQLLNTEKTSTHKIINELRNKSEHTFEKIEEKDFILIKEDYFEYIENVEKRINFIAEQLKEDKKEAYLRYCYIKDEGYNEIANECEKFEQKLNKIYKKLIDEIKFDTNKFDEIIKDINFLFELPSDINEKEKYSIDSKIENEYNYDIKSIEMLEEACKIKISQIKSKELEDVIFHLEYVIYNFNLFKNYTIKRYINIFNDDETLLLNLYFNNLLGSIKILSNCGQKYDTDNNIHKDKTRPILDLLLIEPKLQSLIEVARILITHEELPLFNTHTNYYKEIKNKMKTEEKFNEYIKTNLNKLIKNCGNVNSIKKYEETIELFRKIPDLNYHIFNYYEHLLLYYILFFKIYMFEEDIKLLNQ